MPTSLESRLEHVEKLIRRRHRKVIYRWLETKPGETLQEAEQRIRADVAEGTVMYLLSWLDPA